MARRATSQKTALQRLISQTAIPITDESVLPFLALPTFVIFRTPRFADYDGTKDFLMRSNPFQQLAIQPAESHLHLVLLTEVRLQETGATPVEGRSQYDWARSLAVFNEISENGADEVVLHRKDSYIPMWLTYDWRYFKKEVNDRLIQTRAMVQEE